MTAPSATPPGRHPAPGSDADGVAAPARAGRRLPILVGLVCVVIVAAVAVAVFSSGSGKSGGRSVGAGGDVTDPARFDLPTIDGSGRVRLADFKGKPVVVNFFASWCEPCKAELPEFVTAARKLSGRVAFVGVNSKEITAPSGIALARSMGLADAGITLARDVGGQGGSALHDSYPVRNAMPITAFYDAEGKLRDVNVGQLTGGTLAAKLQELYGVTL
jgi:cytochrome c biogenesis protein CcmG/thiol:disulfide interchange protein DsbE